jgi:SOS response associated peptidase (SRAP)
MLDLEEIECFVKAVELKSLTAATCKIRDSRHEAPLSRSPQVPKLPDSDGFYEWKRTGVAKQPFCFEVNDGELLALAGLWDGRRNAEGQWIETCSILTTLRTLLSCPSAVAFYVTKIRADKCRPSPCVTRRTALARVRAAAITSCSSVDAEAFVGAVSGGIDCAAAVTPGKKMSEKRNEPRKLAFIMVR